MAMGPPGLNIACFHVDFLNLSTASHIINQARSLNCLGLELELEKDRFNGLDWFYLNLCSEQQLENEIPCWSFGIYLQSPAEVSIITPADQYLWMRLHITFGVGYYKYADDSQLYISSLSKPAGAISVSASYLLWWSGWGWASWSWILKNGGDGGQQYGCQPKWDLEFSWHYSWSQYKDQLLWTKCQILWRNTEARWKLGPNS